MLPPQWQVEMLRQVRELGTKAKRKHKGASSAPFCLSSLSFFLGYFFRFYFFFFFISNSDCGNRIAYFVLFYTHTTTAATAASVAATTTAMKCRCLWPPFGPTSSSGLLLAAPSCCQKQSHRRALCMPQRESCTKLTTNSSTKYFN